MIELPELCDFRNRENEPCYGKVISFWDKENWISFCEGHQAVPNGGAYVPEDPIRRLIFSEQNKAIRRLEAENRMLREMLEYLDLRFRLQSGEIEIPEERLETLYAYYGH